jgi:hypothetical protein
MTNTKDDWSTEVASKLSHGVAVTSAGSFLYYELDKVVAVLIKSRIDGEAIGELRGRIKGLREAADVVSLSVVSKRLRARADKLEKGET